MSKVFYVVTAVMAMLMLVITDASQMERLNLTLTNTEISIVSIIGYFYIGFVVSFIIPDAYFDREFDNNEELTKKDLLIPRAIAQLALAFVMGCVIIAFSGKA